VRERLLTWVNLHDVDIDIRLDGYSSIFQFVDDLQHKGPRDMSYGVELGEVSSLSLIR